MSYCDLFDCYDSFFTREDEVDFIEIPLADAIKDQYHIDAYIRCYIEEGNRLDVDISTSDGYEYNIKLDRPIDMRRIRRPSDLSKYVPTLFQGFSEQYEDDTLAEF